MSHRSTDASAKPKLVTTKEELSAELRAMRQAGKSLGLVPTMGALHAGHVSLVRQSVATCDRTIVTIFVNPTQFGPQEDFSKYPRTMQADLAALRSEGADLVFAPSRDEIYAPDFSTYVQPPSLAQKLEGACRPGHFRGVTTVVLKLFLLIPADVAFFGQKDFQQVRVIQQMVRDLDVPIRIHTCPIIREPDGLAMSSRNRYLQPQERQRALALFRSLELAATQFAQGQRDASQILRQMKTVLESHEVEPIDYVALVEPTTLEDVKQVTASTIALIAAYVGNTRLIDNRRMG